MSPLNRLLTAVCSSLVAGLPLLGLLFGSSTRGASATVLGWNNLGMHCMDSDYSVFSILPPYNTIEAQLIVGGRLVKEGTGYTLTYEAVADPTGSINSTAMGKGNFYAFSEPLYGAVLAPETGLAGWAMPGTNNVPQPLVFEATNRPAPGVATAVNWYRAEGIPISPFDDAHRKNFYPLMRVVARNTSGQSVAASDIVLPVSDEMDCRGCHASGTHPGAVPAEGWVWSGYPERDYRLNILRLHDGRQFRLHQSLYAAALRDRGLNPEGLYRTVTAEGRPILCATCHASEALGTGSYSNIPPLTAAMHLKHAGVIDLETGLTLDDTANRAACYQCHPGSTTRCLRGAMGGAVAADGSMAMQCQSCHGSMSLVGAPDRVGWFMEPNCQSCHTGTATHNNGQIRYTSVFETNGLPRQAVDATFATNPNTPAADLSLYRFSVGHGGLQCSACHGSTHAEFPSTHANDNLRNEALQGHAGVLVECTACHTATPSTVNGGPHGMHPVGQSWVSSHQDAAESGGASQCRACHGTDYRGSVLSRAQADRTLQTEWGTLHLFRGANVGCYNCHQGPSNESGNSAAAPVVQSTATNTTSGLPVAFALPVSGSGATARIISQPAHGTVGLADGTATYFPEPGYVGTDAFTFAGWNGSKNSALATATISVTQGPFAVQAAAHVPSSYPAEWPVPFAAQATASNVLSGVTYDWDFGDGTDHSSEAFPSHTYARPLNYAWTLTVTVRDASGTTASSTVLRNIAIGSPMRLTAANEGGPVTVSWPRATPDSLLEESASGGPDASWAVVPDLLHSTATTLSISRPDPTGMALFRLRQVW